jgi:hypothetical protein
MEQILEQNAWIVYPEKEQQNVIMTITFSDNPRYDKFIKILQQKYGGSIGKCNLGRHTRMITIENMDILWLLHKIFNQKKQYSEMHIYKEYQELYKNQHLYFKHQCMI